VKPRGRPRLPADYLFSLFAFVEEERKRTGLSVSRTCDIIAKSGPLQFIHPKTGEIVPIKSGKTLRSRYEEVLAARTMPPPGTLPHEFSNQQRGLDGALLMKADGRIVGFWGPTKKKIQAKRQQSLARQRRKKLHNK
jgi:hypothetical protein